MSSPLSPPFDRIHTSPLSPPYDRIDPSIERRKQPTEHEKIVSLMGGVAVLSVCGMIYGFASYADAIKKQKHFSDSQISTLSSASNLGFCVGPHIGWFVDRYGPRAAAFCAAVSAGIAYAATGWLLVSSQSMMAVMTVLFILLGQGSMCAYMAAIVTYKNFEPSNRGKVIGLLDGTFGNNTRMLVNANSWWDSGVTPSDRLTYIMSVKMTPLGKGEWRALEKSSLGPFRDVFPGPRKYVLSPVFMSRVHLAWERLKTAVRELDLGCYKKRHTHVPGIFIAALYSLQVCRKVDIFGMKLEKGEQGSLAPHDYQSRARLDHEHDTDCCYYQQVPQFKSDFVSCDHLAKHFAIKMFLNTGRISLK